MIEESRRGSGGFFVWKSLQVGVQREGRRERSLRSLVAIGKWDEMEMEASRLQRRTLRSFMNAPSAQATFYAGETFFNQKKKATGKGDFLKKKEE